MIFSYIVERIGIIFNKFCKKEKKNFCSNKKLCNFANAKQYGLLTEWLGAGLQNRLLQFESGRDLQRLQSPKSSQN